MGRLRSIIGKLRPRSNVKKVVLLLVILMMTGSGGFIAISEQTWFCNSCHIMNPYYASWQASGHSEVNCLECHVQPGFSGLVRAKLNGLAQAVDCFLGRVSTKPNALVVDASCLREECHSRESLSDKPMAVVDGKYKFSHQGHIDANVSGLPVRCTVCHNHFEGEEHFSVSTQVCFVCHFSRADAASVRLVDTQCRDCHDVPAEVLKQGQVEIDHGRFVAAQLSCEQLCHKQQVDPNVCVPDVQCLNCHGFRNQHDDDAMDLHVRHSGKDKVECLACHEMIDHTARPIERHHTSLKCDKCHQTPFEGKELAEIEFINMPGDCSLCHNSPHSGQFKKTCQECHSEHGWTGRWVADAHGPEAEFPLLGRHRSVECSGCHTGPELARARFAGLPETCEQCHTDPHDGQFAKGCPTCHSEQGWQNLASDPHGADSSHPLRGKHADLECVKCHTPRGKGTALAEARFAGLADEGCVSCHEDQHNGQIRWECDTCHSELGWKGRFLLFSHDRDQEFRLDQVHSGLPCSSCHKDGKERIYRPLPKTCESCHLNVVTEQLATDGGATNPHAGRVSCVQCHSTESKHQKPSVYASACRTCHNEHYEGLFYDWMKSLNDRESRAGILLEQLRDENAPGTEILEQKISRASRVGFHNIPLAVRLWDEILAETKR